MNYLTIVLCFMFVNNYCYSQVVVSGKLFDAYNNPISNVSVAYKKVGGVAILGYGRSDNLGAYRLEIRIDSVDSIQLNFNHLSYIEKTAIVPFRTGSYSFILNKGERRLEEVKVEDIAIVKNKDTINYNVGAFTSKQDRVIADIIKKLPGIEMRGDQILYQGKPIQKYKVNNLDLMEGRYAMINNNLPADAVSKVQVVENDQPLKILDSLVFSDQASLNLELKKFTTTGTGKAGLGAKPMLWDLNLTPMLFGRKFQMLASFQTNNIGYDASKDLKAFYTGGGYLNSGNANIGDGPTYISVRSVSPPGFDEKRWLDNRIFLFSGNALQKFQNSFELKANISYFQDTRKQRGYTATQYFTDQDIIYNNETVDNSYRNQVFETGVLVEKNEKKVYFRNSFKYRRRWSLDLGELLFNQESQIVQNKLYDDEALQNTLSMARFIGKQLVDIQSSIQYHRTPQRLLVEPGQFVDLLNNGKPFEQMGQYVQYKGLNWTNSIGGTKKLLYWIFSPRVALNYDKNKLNTFVTIKDQNELKKLGKDYINDMDNSQLNLALSLRIGWEKDKWRLFLSSPYNLNYYDVSQHGLKILDDDFRHTFNPSLGMTYLADGRNEVSVSISEGKTFGGLNNFYNGYIIGYYRSMRRYDGRLLGDDNRNVRVAYAYKNTLKANFANLNYQYSQNVKDYIFSTRIDPQGRTTQSIDGRKSTSESHMAAGAVSKFFTNLKTLVKFNGNLGWTVSDYLLNEQLDKRYSVSQSAILEIINSLSTVFSGEYKTIIGRTRSKLSNRVQKIYYNNHYLNFAFYPWNKHSLLIDNAFYTNSIPGQRAQYFLNANYRYRMDKWKTDIEFGVQNLFGNDRFIQQYSNDIELVQSYFELRPRQIIISTKFKF